MKSIIVKVSLVNGIVRAANVHANRLTSTPDKRSKRTYFIDANRVLLITTRHTNYTGQQGVILLVRAAAAAASALER